MKGAKEKITGLRVDVDTLRGTRLGVPGLLAVLAQHQIKATFFFSVGPDNMGRHLWRLTRPSFLVKMLRSRAASLYGWDIILRGTFGPGPVIGDRCQDIIRQTVHSGHEIGLHSWDHYRWQTKIATMKPSAIQMELHQGKETLERLAGVPVVCSAAPGWRCNDTVLLEKEQFDFLYNSDCRGRTIFYPEVGGKKLTQLQIPTTLPTYDELIGTNQITNLNYNDSLLALIVPDQLNVLTIHAEAEGISCLTMFQDFLEKARSRGVRFRPLKDLVPGAACCSMSRVVQKKTEGRDGWTACQDNQWNREHDS